MRAALYLRSSKDRSDVSIDAQRRELLELARTKNLAVVEEFADAVESGKDDQRPGFQAMLSQLKSKQREWDHILAMDTSRIARNQYLAHALHYECDKRNIKIIYSKMPETGSVVDVVIRAVMQSFDQLHSLMSKEKGLAGMAENVKQGFRAGGRAPFGYKLQSLDTGAFRDGASVTKSKLVLGDHAREVKEFFRLRVAGVSRSKAAVDAGLADMVQSSLLGLEWNALTYAGHTVWNVQNERLSSGGYKGGTKRRPRSEWVVQYDTHERLISTDEAEALLSLLENSSRSQSRKTSSEYLLTGLLFNEDGKPYHGCDGIYYRVGKGKRLKKDELESLIIKRIIDEVQGKQFVADLVKATRENAQPIPDDSVVLLRSEVNALTNKIGKLVDVASEAESPRPWLEQIAKLEKQRTIITDRLERAESEYKSAQLLLAISEKDIRKLIDGFAGDLDLTDTEAVKAFLGCVVERVCLTEHPRLTCQIHYRINSGDSLASPRLRHTVPAFRMITMLKAA